MKNVKFREIPRKQTNSAVNTAETQNPRLGSKFRGPRKTVGPSYLFRIHEPIGKCFWDVDFIVCIAFGPMSVYVFSFYAKIYIIIMLCNLCYIVLCIIIS